MSGDSKVGMQVGGVVRVAAVRKIAGEAAAPPQAPTATRTAQDALPVARLIGLASAMAEQAPPVDMSRVATLRSAIANGSYTVDPATIARAMVDFHHGSSN